jgi:hypothetical protein
MEETAMSKAGNERLRLRVLRTGDPRSAFHTYKARDILAMYGPPTYLLSTSAKAEKSTKVGVLNRVLYLTPGVFCPMATPGCLASCLGHTSGRMQMPSSARARDRRSALYVEDQEHFQALLRADLYELRETARYEGMTPAVRLNGTSDIPWEALHRDVFEEFGDIRFFDYTKVAPRMWQFLSGQRNGRAWLRNYHLTFSLSEKNQSDAKELLRQGGNVAVVFWPTVPKSSMGFRVIDGDRHDARFLDPKGVVVGLSAKGIASEDHSGFVVRRRARARTFSNAA